MSAPYYPVIDAKRTTEWVERCPAALLSTLEASDAEVACSVEDATSSIRKTIRDILTRGIAETRVEGMITVTGPLHLLNVEGTVVDGDSDQVRKLLVAAARSSTNRRPTEFNSVDRGDISRLLLSSDDDITESSSESPLDERVPSVAAIEEAARVVDRWRAVMADSDRRATTAINLRRLAVSHRLLANELRNIVEATELHSRDLDAAADKFDDPMRAAYSATVADLLTATIRSRCDADDERVSKRTKWE